MSTLIVGIGPIGLDAEGERRRTRLARALESSIRASIEVRAAYTYSELLGWVGRREVHLAWLGPALFVQAHARFGVEALVRAERRGRQTFRGALFVRADSKYQTLDDVRGARIAWVDPDSCAGFLFPRIALAQRGLDPDSTFRDLRILGSHSAVVRAVEAGQVEVGATFVELSDPDDAASEIVRAGWHISSVPMRALLVTDAVPADVVVATRAVDAEARAMIQRGLEALGASAEGSTVLHELFQASSLRPVTTEEYAPVRDALRAAGIRV